MIEHYIKIKIYSYNIKILTYIKNELVFLFRKKYIKGYFFNLKIRKKFSILRSPFVNKDSRDSLEIELRSLSIFIKFKYIKNIIKFFKLLFKKFSFDFSNNIYLEISKQYN